MLFKPILLITSITTSIGKTVLNIETEHLKIPKNEIQNDAYTNRDNDSFLETKSITNKEFCIYTKNSMIKILDPYYVDFSNNTIYFDNIEDYARYIGPDWFGVSYCGNNTVVNNVGSYFKVSQNKKGKRENKTSKNKEANNDIHDTPESNKNAKDANNEENEEELSIYRARTKEEYKEEIKKLYEKFIGNGMKSLSLTSKNPAYNPYHPALIKIKDIDEDKINYITTMGMPYEADKSLYENLVKDGKSKFEDCASITREPGSVISCTIAYTEDIQNTVSISNNDGKSYHKSYGKVYSKGDTTTKEINESLQLANALSYSTSTHESDSKGYSESLEKVYAVIDSESLARTKNKETTHTESTEHTTSHMVSEEHAHTVTNSKDVTDETNWSNSIELSHTDEVSKMGLNDFNNVKELIYKENKDEIPDGDISNPSKFEKSMGGLYENYIYPIANIANGNNVFDSICDSALGKGPILNRQLCKLKNSKREYTAPTAAEDNSRKLIKRGIVPGLSEAVELFSAGTNGAGMADQSRLQRVSIRSEENSAIDQLNQQYQLALAGTRSSSDTLTHGSTKGGSHSVTQGWAESNTSTSGVSDGWTKSNGYSDSYTTGHSETSNKEHSVSDSTSKMFSKSFNKETGWVNEESTSDTKTKGYTYGNSFQTNTNEQNSYDNAIETSAQHTFEMSNTTSISQTKTSTIQLTVNDSSCQELVALPLFLTEVIIWATGHITESSHTKITYNKSLIPVKFSGFTHTLKHCEEKYQYESELVNHDIDKYVFQTLDKENPYINTLPSNKELTPNRYISSKSGKHSFGLLPTGELVLCRGKDISNCEGSNKLWTNGITTFQPNGNHDLKFFIGDNGHLYITAKNIYKKDIANIKYSNDFIYLIDSYVNDDSTPLDDNKKDFKNKLEEYYKKNNIEKRLYIPDEGDEDDNDDDDDDDDFDFDKFFGDKTTATTTNSNLRSTVSTTKATTTAKTTTTTKTSSIIKTTATGKSTTTTKTTNTSIMPTSNNNNSNSIVVVSNKYCNKYNNDGAFGWYEIDDDEKCIIVNKEKAEKIINSISSSSPQKTSTSQATSTTVNEPTVINENNIINPLTLSDDDYIVWDSLPKDLPFNVGFPDDKGYYLYIDDHVDSRRGARVTLYDGVGVKIWEIYGKQDNYHGYAFPVEYVYPLSIDTTIPFKDEEYYDKHNILNQAIVKDLNTDQIEMNCKNILKENEALVSKNKKYRFFVQKTGNMVIKENSRTTWSSMTANIEIFEGPYHLALSKIGEFILRDKNNYSLWHSTNLISYDNKNTKIKYYLKISNEGELLVIDENENVYWSNWDKRLYSRHSRFVNPVLYEISSCDEHIRPKEIYNLFAETGLYDYYLKPDNVTDTLDDPIYIKKYYFNNLLPGESLLSNYNAYLNVTENDLIYTYNNEETIIKTCKNNKGIKELQLNNNGLYLYCNEKNSVINIALLEGDDQKNKYNRLSIEYRANMDKPELMIFNVKTWEPVWKLSGIRYLKSIREFSEPRWNKYNTIYEDHIMNAFDRLESSDKSNTGDFIYLSSITGLEFKNGVALGINNLTLANNNFYINDKPVINNKIESELEVIYNGESDKLILLNNTVPLWELYGSISFCDYFISNNKTCNKMYSYNHRIIGSSLPNGNDKHTLYLHFYNNTLDYINFNENTVSYFDINEYAKIKEPIYLLSITDKGNIELNNGEYILHKEYYKADEYYYLYVSNDNLILRSSTGEYKWAANKTISNRPYDASEISVGDSFKEGEMLYCGDYSVTILNGKLLYRDHKKQTSTEIKNYGGNKSAYLYKIIVGNNSLTFRDKNNEDIDNILSNKKSKSSKLRCDKSNHGIVWDNGNNQILWKYSSSDSFNPKSNAVWLYNKYYNKCLYTSGFKNEPITYEDCVDRNKYKWYFEKIDGNTYFISAAKKNLCMRAIKNRMTLGECDEKAILKYIKASKSIKSGNKCLSGIDDNNDPYSQYEVKLSSCNRHDEKQMWEFISDISTITN